MIRAAPLRAHFPLVGTRITHGFGRQHSRTPFGREYSRTPVGCQYPRTPAIAERLMSSRASSDSFSSAIRSSIETNVTSCGKSCAPMRSKIPDGSRWGHVRTRSVGDAQRRRRAFFSSTGFFSICASSNSAFLTLQDCTMHAKQSCGSRHTTGRRAVTPTTGGAVVTGGRGRGRAKPRRCCVVTAHRRKHARSGTEGGDGPCSTPTRANRHRWWTTAAQQ